MTNEKLYTLAVEAIKELCSDAATAKDIITHAHAFKNQTRYANTAQLLLALQEKLDSTGGKTRVVTAEKRMLKVMGTNGRHSPHGWIDADGRFCVCSGYHAARLTHNLSSIPRGEQTFDLDKVMKRPQSLTPVNLPSVGEIKAHIAANRDCKYPASIILNINGFEWVCNAQYLLDMLQILPDCTAYAPDGPLAPMWFSAPDGSDGTLPPVRIRRNPTVAAD